jgi:hypothetical protein
MSQSWADPPGFIETEISRIISMMQHITTRKRFSKFKNELLIIYVGVSSRPNVASTGLSIIIRRRRELL